MLTITEKKSTQCQICKEYFKSSKECIWHIKKEHNIKDFESYILLVYYNNEYPLCKCGCNTKLTFKGNKLGPFFSDYAKNHWPHKLHSLETINKIRTNTREAIQKKYGVDNVYKLKPIKNKIKNTKFKKYDNENYNNSKQSLITKLKKYNAYISESHLNKIIDLAITGKIGFKSEKFKQTMVKLYGIKNIMKSEIFIKKMQNSNFIKYGYNNIFEIPEYRKKYNVKTSKIENEIADKLSAEHKFVLENHEYDIKLDNNIIEIDGDFWHPNKLEYLTFSQINNVINDKHKIDIIKNSNYSLYKIHISKLPENITLENIIQNSYIPNYNIACDQKIISKNYFKDYIEKKGKAKLEKYINLLLRFIRTFQLEFPYPECIENLQDVTNDIQNNKLNIYNKDTKTFNNNTSTIGHNYLKSHFKSYWNSNYNKMMSPVEAWKDNKTMLEVIKYRIGLNNSNEVFDFSMKNLVKGLQVRKIGISFFKPILAAEIYKVFLKNIENPTVIDPCAGFGSRLLGFKSKYPNGTYIGIEPNIETYNELQQLVSEAKFTNIKLYNCKLEDYNENKECDLTFTSIPYFDTEVYSNNTEYSSFEDWKNTFINSLLTFNNLLVNIPEKFESLFNYSDKYFIKSSVIHFNKSKKEKYELLLKLF